MQHEHSASGAGFLPAHIGNVVSDIILSDLDGEPRARDLDIAERLGYERLTSIRVLIERNRDELETFGPLHQSDAKSSGGRPGADYWLTEEQALLVAARSDAENAPLVRRMLIKVFVAWRRGHLQPVLPSPREHRLYLAYMEKLVGRLGVTGKEAVFAANRATAKVTGIDVLAAAGIEQVEADTDQALLNAGDIGYAIGGVSAQDVNRILIESGYQEKIRTKKGRIKYQPTDKGKEAGGQMVMVERSNETGTALQPLWSSSIVDVVRTLVGRAGA